MALVRKEMQKTQQALVRQMAKLETTVGKHDADNRACKDLVMPMAAISPLVRTQSMQVRQPRASFIQSRIKPNAQQTAPYNTQQEIGTRGARFQFENYIRNQSVFEHTGRGGDLGSDTDVNTDPQYLVDGVPEIDKQQRRQAVRNRKTAKTPSTESVGNPQLIEAADSEREVSKAKTQHFMAAMRMSSSLGNTVTCPTSPSLLGVMNDDAEIIAIENEISDLY